jgi:hypothetical protein
VAVPGAVAILYRDDGDDPARDRELLRLDVREAHVPHLSLLAQLGQRPHGFLQRHVGVHSVELVDVDPLQPQAAQAPLASLVEVVRATVSVPLPGARSQEPALGRDHQVVRIGMERLGDQALAHLGPVRVRRVDEVDSQVDGASKDPLRGLGVGRIAPDPGAGDSHRPEAHPADLEVAAQRERAGGGGGSSVGHSLPPYSRTPTCTLSR